MQGAGGGEGGQGGVDHRTVSRNSAQSQDGHASGDHSREAWQYYWRLIHVSNSNRCDGCACGL